MFKTPYQTTVGSSYAHLVPTISSALQRAHIHGDLHEAKLLDGRRVEGVVMVGGNITDIKPFPFPIEFEVNGEKLFAVDVRMCTRYNRGEDLKVVSGGDYEGLLLRAALMRYWSAGGNREMRRWNEIAVKAFVRITSEALIRRLNLPPADQQAVIAMCGYFYFAGFIGTEISAVEKEVIAVAVARATRLPVVTATDIICREGPVPVTLQDFTDALRNTINNPRLEHLDAATIVSLMGGIWFGANAKVTIAVALEYRPFWIGLIFQALQDRTFGNSNLTKIVEQENRNRAATAFVRELSNALEIESDD